MEEHELVAAIAEAPDDDAPRMVYADWLMQRDDPRGELIALQCTLAAAHAADVVLPDEKRVVARERALREAHAEAWFAPLRQLVLGGYELRRGFIEHVAVFRDADLADVERVVAIAPLLRSLTVRETFVVASELSAALSRLDSLTIVEPSGLAPTPLRAFVTGDLRALRRVQIVNARLTVEAVEALLELPHTLDHLGLDLNRQYTWSKVRADAIVQQLATRRSLRTLELAGISPDSAEPLVALERLERLALHHCRLRVPDLVALVSQLPCLVALDLDTVELSEGEVADVVAAAPRLRRLRAANSKLGDADAIALAESPHTSRLRSLVLAGNGIGQHGAVALATSAHLGQLIRLDLTGAQRDDATRELERARNVRIYRAPVPTYPELLEPLAQGMTIEAVKIYRDLTGAGLAESKMAVERIADERAQ